MENNLRCALTGETIHRGDFDYDMQEFVLKRMEGCISDDNNVEAQINCYRRGILDGIKMVLTLQK